MKIRQPWRVALLAAALITMTAQADSSVSSASSAGSASSGSVSDSLSSSSNSSGGNQRKVADGHYRILQIAATPEHSERTRLTLQGDAPEQRIELDLPRTTFAAQQLTVGASVYAQNRVYGIEFGRTAPRQPFYLVLADAWYGELASRPVSL